jgi:LacI family transcriptional regulator
MPPSRRIPQVLLLIETSRAYGRGLVEGIARYAEENGPWSIFFEERGLADPLPRRLKQWRGDGIISRTLSKADIARLLAMRLPVVELYAGPKSGMPRVYQNEEAVGRLAAEHFFDCGLRNFAFFATDHAFWIEGRRRAFQRGLRQRESSCQAFEYMPGRIIAGEKSRQFDDRSVIRWLRKLPLPCGVFCASDFYAMRLMRACRAGGILVPEQIAILGVDNDPVFCGTCFPRLSSIDLGSSRIGYEAAALLDRMMASKSPPKGGVSVDPLPLIARESTDILAMDDAEMVLAARMIREQACDRLRVSQIAAALGLSLRVFEIRFQRAAHCSPKEAILRVRLERAKMLLATSNHAVASVAKKCGFGSQEYFARLFRRRTGMTPRIYCNECRMPAKAGHSQ